MKRGEMDLGHPLTGVHDVAIDKQGNIYTTGYTKNFGEGEEDAFLVKYTKEGQLLTF